MSNKKFAFSIAEAMITLTIIAVMSACAAPLISKQMKNNEFSDIQAKRLNEKIDVLNKEVSKIDQDALWGLSSDKKSVYRNGGNVGIGTNSPIAKLQVNVPEYESNNYIMSIIRNSKQVFGITGLGRVEIKNGLNFALPTDKDVNYLTTYETVGTGKDEKTVYRHSLRRDGSILTRVSESNIWPLAIQNESGENILYLDKRGTFYIGRREVGANRNVYKLVLSRTGVLYLTAPTRAEAIAAAQEDDPTYPGDPVGSTRDDARAFSIRYPADWTDEKDCCDLSGNPITNNGLTETAFFNSNGSLYINSIINKVGENAGSAIQVRDGSTPRASIDTDGILWLFPKTRYNETTGKETSQPHYALVVRKSMEEYNAGDKSLYAYITKDGDAYFKNSVKIGTKLVNTALLDKIDVNNAEINNAKQLIAQLDEKSKKSDEIIAQLKLQNELLTEKMSQMEIELAQIKSQNQIAKITPKGILPLFK